MRSTIAVLLLVGSTGTVDPAGFSTHGVAEPQPITELVLERGACFGTCPMYRIVLRSDGSATYVGWNYVDRVGVYTGTLAHDEFEHIVEILENVGFWQMKESYLHPINDLPVVLTAATRADRTRKVVRDHGVVGVPGIDGPTELKAIQSTIDDLATRIHWEPTDESPSVFIPGIL